MFQLILNSPIDRKVAVNAFFEILAQLVNSSSFIENQGFVAHSLYFAAKTIVFFAVFHGTLLTFVFQIIHTSYIKPLVFKC